MQIGNYSAALHLHEISLSYIALVCEVYAKYGCQPYHAQLKHTESHYVRLPLNSYRSVV